MQDGYDCVFGSRFMRGAQLVDYPLPKKVMNRLANLFIRTLFWMPYNDVTNAFKLYRRDRDRRACSRCSRITST